jgi:hypothetical protein
MNDVITRHLDAIDAQLELLKAQIRTIRHALTEPAPPKVSIPETCQAIDAAQCGRRNADAWISRGTFSQPHAKRCVGCGEESTGVN